MTNLLRLEDVLIKSVREFEFIIGGRGKREITEAYLDGDGNIIFK